MLSNDIQKYIGEISGASARHFANATRADESVDDVLAARLRVEAHVLLAVAVKLDQILSVNEPKKDVQPQLNKHDVVRCKELLVQMLTKERNACNSHEQDETEWKKDIRNVTHLEMVLLMLDDLPAL